MQRLQENKAAFRCTHAAPEALVECNCGAVVDDATDDDDAAGVGVAVEPETCQARSDEHAEHNVNN